MFPEDLSKVPIERETDYVIDHLPNTDPISILPYRIALAELIELNDHLKDLLKRFLLDVVFFHGVKQCCSSRINMVL